VCEAYTAGVEPPPYNQPDKVGLHREATSSTKGGFHPTGSDFIASLPHLPRPTVKPKLKYADFDPEEALQNAIRNSGFFDDEDE